MAKITQTAGKDTFNEWLEAVDDSMYDTLT